MLDYAGFNVLTAMLVKMKLYLDVIPRWWVNTYVLEEPAASI
jgi:hypothetical protein